MPFLSVVATVLFQDDSQDAKIKITYAGVSSSLSSNNSFAAVPLTSEWGQHGKDVYSVGMIAYKLFSGGKEPPTDMDTQLVAHGTNLFLGRRWKLISISRNAKQFIEKCLQSDSTRQHTLEQAMVHPWITQERSHRSIVAVSLAATNASSLLSSPTVSSFSQQQSKSREEKKVESCSDPVDGGIVDNSDVARTLAVVSLSTKQYNLDVKSKQDEDVDNGDVARTGVAVSLSTEQYILDLKSKRDDMEGDVVDSTILEYPADTNVISDNNVANEGNHFSEVDQSVPVPLVLIPTSTGPLERHETLQPAPESEACDDQTDQETIVQNVPGAESILMNFSIGEPLVYTDNPSNDPSDSSQIVDEVDAAKATKEEHEKNHDKGDETPHFLAGDTVDSDDDSFGPIPSNDLEPVTNDVSTMDSDGLDEVEPADEDVGDGNKEEPPTEQANPPGDETQSSANDAIQPNKSDELETTVIQSSDREVQDDDVGADAMSFAGSTEKADADVEIDATLFTNDGAETEAWMGDSTPAEFHDLRDMLAEAETEKGGDYTVEELKAKLTTKYTEEEVDSWFQGGRFDDTRNLKYTEFLSTVIKSRRTIEIRRIKEAFLAIDKGKRGFVTVGNLRAVLGSNNSENTEMLIKAADSKRDGRISFENFEDVVKQWAGEDHADD